MRFIPAVIVSAAVIVGGPTIGQLRAALQAAFPAEYRSILVATVATCVGGAVGTALYRIRERRVLRYTLIASAVGIGTTYALLSRTGDPAVDAIERFHFVEYGLITLLFYFVYRPTGDASSFLLPALAAILVGTLEEWLQWFVPARVGEVRDILLNFWAILCGLLFAVALSPPQPFRFSLRPASWLRVRRMSALVVLLFAGFFHFAHLGHEIVDTEAGAFRSRYSANRILEVARKRSAQWQREPPLTWSRYSREDQYFSEGLALVRLRNRCWDTRDVVCAWRANLILERYYAPVIDTPSYISATGHRWATEQRRDAEERVKGADRAPTLVDENSAIYVWPKSIFWLAVAILIAMLLLL